MAVGDRATALRDLLRTAGHRVGKCRLPLPSSDTLPSAQLAAALDVYRQLGGIQTSPRLRPGNWDLGCDAFAVELDEDLHFNRYRKLTLSHQAYGPPSFPANDYSELCERFEAQCLAKGRGQARWTSPATERQFGAAGPRGVLAGPGAPRWKQRALYDFVKDLAPLVGGPSVARIGVWEALDVDGVPIRIDALLRSGVRDRKAAGILAALVRARACVE